MTVDLTVPANVDYRRLDTCADSACCGMCASPQLVEVSPLRYVLSLIRWDVPDDDVDRPTIFVDSAQKAAREAADASAALVCGECGTLAGWVA